MLGTGPGLGLGQGTILYEDLPYTVHYGIVVWPRKISAF